jgi:hypothetical protein
MDTVEKTKATQLNPESRILVSFSHTFTAYAGGFEILETDQFAFGCQRQHLLRDDGLIPREVTWINDLQRDPKRLIVGRDVQPGELSQPLLDCWLSFLGLLTTADQRGEVEFNVGPYMNYCLAHLNAVWPGNEQGVALFRQEELTPSA